MMGAAPSWNCPRRLFANFFWMNVVLEPHVARHPSRPQLFHYLTDR